MAQISRRVSDAFSAFRRVPERISDAFSPFQSEENAIASGSSPSWPSPERRTADIGPLTARDVEALARVIQSEIGHWSAAKLDTAVAPHVASILNRVASPAYADTISEVVNQRQQYSAINPLGSWEKLPPAKPAVQQRVESALYEMAMGRPQTRSTHFLNPDEVRQEHLDRWGNRVVAEAIRDGEVFGNPPKDAHYMGIDPTMRQGDRPSVRFAPGYSPAAPAYVTAERDFRLANGVAPPGALFGTPEAASVEMGRSAMPPAKPVRTGRDSAQRASSISHQHDIPFLNKLRQMAR